MTAILHLLLMFVGDIFKSRRRLEAENLFLRHQLNIALRRAPHRLRLRGSDRVLLIADFVEKVTTYAASVADPGEYGKLIAARLCSDTLPYELGTSAAFEVASFNGRALGDDALDVMLTLATNTLVVDGLAPDHARISKDFPYYGLPYTAEEQVGVTPRAHPAKK
jgi:hypothetical protein